jgi:hypothetical protein
MAMRLFSCLHGKSGAPEAVCDSCRKRRCAMPGKAGVKFADACLSAAKSRVESGYNARFLNRPSPLAPLFA